MLTVMMRRTLPVVLVAFTGAACDGAADAAPSTETGAAEAPGVAGADTVALDTTDVVFTVTGLAGPEAVRFDPDQQVWFVANFGAGQGDTRDSDGFISRIGANGAVESLEFMRGTADAPLHQARGMFIVGDTLWVADVDGIHGFDRTDGSHLAFVDFTMHEPGFLNDIAAGPDGVLYVTDSGQSRVYRVPSTGGAPEIAADSLPASPNGITWDDERSAFLLAPWQGDQVVRSLTTDGALDSVAETPAGRTDGIEVIESGILVATQEDMSLWVLADGASPRHVVSTRGRPADIGYDAARGLVAVPYIALDRVDVWRVR